MEEIEYLSIAEVYDESVEVKLSCALYILESIERDDVHESTKAVKIETAKIALRKVVKKDC